MVEVILKKEVRKLGERGDVVRVAPGYARNFLFPRELAMPATATNKKQIDQMQAAAAREALQLRGDAQKLADLMQDLTVRVVAKAGDSNQLFGSVSTRDISALLAEQGFEIDRHKITLEKPIKEVGDFAVRVHLYKDVRVVVTVEVRAEGREDEPLVAETEGAEETEESAASDETAESNKAAEPTEAAETAEEAEED